MTTASRAEMAVEVERLPLQRLGQTFAPSLDCAERAVLIPVAVLPQMPGIRNRGQRARLVVGDDDGSPESGQILTPSSSEDEAEAEDAATHRLLAFAKTASRSLLAKILPNSFFHPTIEEQKQFDGKYGYDKLVWKKVETYPQGYPQAAAFVNSDDTFANFRRFGRMSSRILLHLQNELTELEAKLDELDLKDAANDEMKFRLTGHENYGGWDDTQKKLISLCKEKWAEYADLVLKEAQFRALGKAPVRNHLANFDWYWKNRPFAEGKFDFIFHADDFVSLTNHSQKERRVENFIEGYLDNNPKSLAKRFLVTKTEVEKTGDKRVYHYSSLRLEILAHFLAVSLGVGMLLIPVFILFLVPMSRVLMAVTASVFIIVFSVLVLTATGAKLHEVFFGVAAFAAILIMFLGNIQSGNAGGPK